MYKRTPLPDSVRFNSNDPISNSNYNTSLTKKHKRKLKLRKRNKLRERLPEDILKTRSSPLKSVRRPSPPKRARTSIIDWGDPGKYKFKRSSNNNNILNQNKTVLTGADLHSVYGRNYDPTNLKVSPDVIIQKEQTGRGKRKKLKPKTKTKSKKYTHKTKCKSKSLTKSKTKSKK